MKVAAEGQPLGTEMYSGELAIATSHPKVEDADSRRKSSLIELISIELGGNNCSRVLVIFLLSALVITAARVLSPFEVGKDQSVQLETAQRLADGLGLTTTNQANSPVFDISEPPAPGYLSQWPPGFSIVIAGFLLTGLPLVASLKIVYGVTTLLGWLGWANIASYLTSEPIRIGTRDLNLHFFAAAILPILTTPLWNGTDIFLWAGIPYLVLLLNKNVLDQRSYAIPLFAGLLFGFLCAMRYASAFLALASVLILVQVSYPRFKPFLGRLVVFFLPSMVIILSFFAYMSVTSHDSSGLPAQLDATSGGIAALLTKAQAILRGSSVTSYLIFGFPLLDAVVTRINFRPFSYAVGTICLLVILLLPLVVLKSRASINSSTRQHLVLSLSFLPLSLTVFLAASRLLSDWALFKIRRYYEPLILGSIFLFYELATRRGNYRIIRASSIVIVSLFIGYTLLFNAAQLLLPNRRDQLIQSVLAFTPARSARQHSTSQDLSFPSREIYSWKESSRLKVKQLYEAHPEALFIAQEYPLYIYDGFQGEGPVPGKHLIDYQGANYLRQAYTSRAIKVFWVMASGTKLDFIDDSHLKLVHSDPIEKTSIYESDLPAGFRFLTEKR